MPVSQFPITLTVKGPLLTNSSVRGGFGIDAYMARSQGNYYLPGSEVKGLLRMAWQQIKSAGANLGFDIDTELGKESSNGDEPDRAKLAISDLYDPQSASRTSRTIYRNRIDSFRGSVQEQQLLVVETPYSAGDSIAFSGTVTYLGDATAAAGIAKAISKGLCWVPAIGAEKSVGFGRLTHCSCGSPKTVVLDPDPGPSDWYDIDISPAAPFCVAQRRIADNIFESEPFIPGSVIKGCLARVLPSINPVEFHRLRILHAFPLTSNGRLCPPPLSFFHYKNGQNSCFADALTFTSAFLIDNRAPEFMPDWKDTSTLDSYLRTPTLHRELRVRTAISPQTGSADDEKLFAMRLIVPNGVTWRSRICLAKVSSATRKLVLDALRQGLFFLGKTKCSARVALHGTSAPTVTNLQPGQQVTLMLRTPALLLNPSAPCFQQNRMDRAALRAEYEQLWHDLSVGSLQLDNYFQSNSLAGGGYFARRFQIKNGDPATNTYRPYLLTAAGSVFRFTVADPALAHQSLSKWSTDGLPLPSPVLNFYNLTDNDQIWKHCPYVPQSGFGEVVVDHPIHSEPQFQPPANRVTSYA